MTRRANILAALLGGVGLPAHATIDVLTSPEMAMAGTLRILGHGALAVTGS